MRKICSLILCLCMFISVLPVQSFADDIAQGVSVSSGSNTKVKFTSEGSGAMMYLSDFSTSSMLRCKVGWGSYMRDRNIDNNGKVSLLTAEGKTTEFEKSVAAHASADLIYDLGSNHTYTVFHSWVGLDSHKGNNGDGVKFAFYWSDDAVSWTEFKWDRSDTAFKGSTVAEEIELDITGHRYLRVKCDKGSTDAYDHSSLGDAYVKDASKQYVAPVVSLPDSGSLSISGDANQAGFKAVTGNSSSELALLQYTLYQKCGEENLRIFFTTSSQYKERAEAFNWLYNDYEALQEFMNGGIPNNGSYISALEVFASIYAAHKDDLNDTGALLSPDNEHKNDTRGDLYRRMMLSLSLVCAGGWSGWMSNAGIQDPVKRYEYFKENYTSSAVNADGTVSASKMRCDIFENLGVDEMRWVVGNNISNAEIVWLNDYARATPKGGNQTSYPILYSPHHHISYRWYNYDKDEFYDESNREKFVSKYLLKTESTDYSKYGLTYGLTDDGTKVQRLWMVFEDGAVCGNISRTGANLGACFGVPACEVGQPGHAAFLIMGTNSYGEMTWGIDNDISGWMQSTNSRRMPCDWGLNGDSWISGCRASYVLLSQAALNHLDDYSKAEEIMMMYDYCQTDSQREACCRAAMSYMSYHLDAWLKLVQMYCSGGSYTSDQLSALAEELCSEGTGMCYYPKPMYDLVQLIVSRLKTMCSDTGLTDDQKVNTEVQLATVQMALNSALKLASKTTDAEHKCAQPSACRQNANYFLSSSSYNLATFSFNGENSNKIVFNSDFTSVRFKICLNSSGDNPVWSDSISEYADDNGVVSYDLSSQLENINAADDIYIWLDGWSGSPNINDAFCIDIKDGAAVTGLDFNDNENRCFGTTDNVEYKLDDDSKWSDLSASTVIEGAHTVTVRKKANGTTLRGTESTFTTNEDNASSRVYIPISRMSVAAYSSEETSKNDYAMYVIDGKTSTRWHTLWNKTDTAKYITLKTDTPAYFTGLDYTPVAGGGNGTIYSAVAEVSLDGTYWMTAANISGWKNDGNTKNITFTPVYGQYVRIRVTDSCGGFVSARKFELFENTTLKNKQISGISLVSNPSKLTYIKGEKLDLTGASARITYSDGTHAVLPVSLLTPDTQILNTVSGSYRVRLSYGRYSTSFHVKVEDAGIALTSIKIISVPYQTSLYTNEALNPEGMTVTATDGSTTVYLDQSEYTLSGNTDVPTADGETTEITVALKSNPELTDTYRVSVKKCIDRIELISEPEKKTYDLGDAFVSDGVSVQAVYLNESGTDIDSTRTLNESEYELEGIDVFSENAGNQTIQVVLSDNPSVSTYFTVQVYPRFTYQGVLYSADDNGTTCSVAYVKDVPADGFISVPETVRFGSTVYTVTGVAEGALDNTTGVKAIALPGTVTALAEHALDGGDGLTTLYLTAHTDFSDISVAENSLNSDVEIILYAANDTLKSELSSQLEKTVPYLGVAVGNVQSEIDNITVTPPLIDSVPLGYDMSKMDWSGYAVTAVLSNGNTVPLDASSCTRSEIDTSEAGKKTVTVCLIVNENEKYASTFEITVLESNLYFDTNPMGAFYFSSQDEIVPLTAEAKASDNPALIYTWYRSADGTRNPDTDLIPNASGSSYVPVETGYYYTGATIAGTEFTVYSLAAEVDIGNYAVIAGNKNSDGSFTWIKGYDSLGDALSSSASGEYVKLTQDIILPSMVTVGRNATLLGDGHRITRGSSLTGSMFYLNGKALTVDDITVDGGANWHGTSKQYSEELLRYWLGTQYSGTIFKCSGASRLNLESGAVLCNNYNASTQTKDTTGGAVYAEGTSQIIINGARILDCWSKLFGSAIYARDYTSITINDGEFKGNSGTGDGSGNYNTSVICVDNYCECTVNGGWFHHNSGAAKGGIFWVSNGRLSIKGGTFSDNIATNGKTVYLYGSASVELGGDFQIEDIYLTNGRTVTITDEIQPGSVNIITQSSTVGTDAVIVSSDVELASAIQGIIINGKTPGIDTDNGKLQVACTGDHTYALNSDGSYAKRTIEAGTCAAPGLECEYCSQCGALIGTPARTQVTHSYEKINAKAATCTEEGHEEGQRCTVCGHVEGCASVAAKGHEYHADSDQHVDSTCTSHGKDVYVCSVCGAEYTEELDILGHKFEISSDGISTCTRCGEKRNDTLPDNNVQHTETDAFEPSLESTASSEITPEQAIEKLKQTVYDNSAVSGFESSGMNTKVSLQYARTALQNVSGTVTDNFDASNVEDSELSLYVQVTAKDAKFEKRNISKVSELDTAITCMTFDVTPVISTIVTTISGEQSWDTLLKAEIPNEAINSPVSFRLPVDSNVPTGASVIVWHHPNDVSKEYFGTYKVESESDVNNVEHKYVELESKSFSTFSYELPDDIFELEGLARNVSLDESLSINYKVKVSGYTDPYIEFDFYDDTVGENGGYVTTQVFSYNKGTYTDDSGEQVNCLVFSFDGVNPQRMRDNLRATLYAKYNGETVSYTFSDYSIRDYLANMLKKLDSADREAYCDLFCNLINYGSNAQIHQNYESDNLISNDPDFASLMADYENYDHSSEQVTSIQTLDRVEGGADIKAVSLILSGYVGVRVYFDLNDDIPLDGVKFVAKINDRTIEYTNAGSSFTQDGNRYYFTIRAIKSTEYGSDISIQSYVESFSEDSTEAVWILDDTVHYNVNNYLVKYMNDNADGALIKALFNYGYAAGSFNYGS